MKLLIRALFYLLVIYVSYLLVAALARKDAPAAQLLQQYAEKNLQQYLCQTPVSWRIGQLDPAFDLTLEQAEQAAHNAATKWNTALGRELFRYDSLDGFAINFAYDERQQLLLQQARLQRNLQRYDSNIDQRHASLQQQAAQLAQRQQLFSQQNQQFAEDVAAFERKIQQASNANRSALQQEQQQLLSRQQQLQQQAELLNSQQQSLQREQQYLNDTVADRNALLPQQPAEISAAEVGVMQISGRSRSMTIFAYTSPAALELTLLHEFGHALGLGHTDSPSSAMYYALSAAQSGLSAEDVQALKQQCGF